MTPNDSDTLDIERTIIAERLLSGVCIHCGIELLEIGTLTCFRCYLSFLTTYPPIILHEYQKLLPNKKI